MMRKGVLAFLVLGAGAFSGVQAGARTTVLSPLESVKLLYQRGRYAEARDYGYPLVWDDLNQPEPLYYVAQSLGKLGDRDQAAAFFHILLRVLDENPKSKADARAPAWRAACQNALRTLDQGFEQARKKHADAAKGRKFTSPEEVDDLWMTDVRCDLHPLHGLYAWKLVGGRKDAARDWIHNTQGTIHRSGAKLMELIHGRRGVLFCIPNRKSHRLSRIFWDGPRQAAILRIGTRGYGFSFLLNVLVGEKQVFSQTIGTDSWADLRIPLGADAGTNAPLILELVVPETQRWSEGAFFDYIDLFEN